MWTRSALRANRQPVASAAAARSKSPCERVLYLTRTHLTVLVQVLHQAFRRVLPQKLSIIIITPELNVEQRLNNLLSPVPVSAGVVPIRNVTIARSVGATDPVSWRACFGQCNLAESGTR